MPEDTDQLTSEIKRLKAENRRLKSALEAAQKPKKDWFTLSKIITYFVFLIYAVGNVAAVSAAFRYSDGNIIIAVVSANTVVASVGVRSYFNKSGLEFKLNKMKEMGVKPKSDDFNLNFE